MDKTEPIRVDGRPATIMWLRDLTTLAGYPVDTDHLYQPKQGDMVASILTQTQDSYRSYRDGGLDHISKGMRDPPENYGWVGPLELTVVAKCKRLSSDGFFATLSGGQRKLNYPELALDPINKIWFRNDFMAPVDWTISHRLSGILVPAPGGPA